MEEKINDSLTEDNTNGESVPAAVPLAVIENPHESALPPREDTASPAREISDGRVPDPSSVLRAGNGKAAFRERLRLAAMLAAVMLATVGVIVWGCIVTDRISRVNTPLGSTLLGNFFGSGVTSVGGALRRPSLDRIPSNPVEEGQMPGAAEDETAPDGEGTETVPDGERLPVKKVDLSVNSGDVFSLINETPYLPDVIALYAEDMKTRTLTENAAIYGEGAPQVLIIHTHGTESYFGGGEFYLSNDPFRTYDTELNVVSVGREIAARLKKHGVGVIHIETMFDGESYNEAYVKSASEVRRILAENPSIEYVFDVHRDAMFTREGVCLAPTSPLTADGGDVAQIMLVVGTDHAGAPHGEWQDNLGFALKLQKSILGVNAGTMRSINLRSASFNAQYAKGSVLVEIGSAGNTLEEALRAGRIFADGVADVICGDGNKRE